MRFTVMRIHSEHLTKYALTLTGYPTGKRVPIVPRYLKKSFDYEKLAQLALKYNAQLKERGLLLPTINKYRLYSI